MKRPWHVWAIFALCLAAGPPLLALVLKALGIPKRLRRVPRWGWAVLDAAFGLLQFALPWLGWALLLWVSNRHRLPFASALWLSASIALVSYLTGSALVLAFRPRPRSVELTRLEVGIPGLPEAFDGYRILHLSDTHAGLFVSPGALAARLRAAGSLDPDLIVFTGDLADRSFHCAEAAAGLLAGLHSGGGVVAVLGNHDHWIGEEQVARALSLRGVEVLANTHLAVRRGGGALYFAGVKDASYLRQDDLAAALACIPDGAPVILLSHTPDIVRKPPSARAALTLSGHTHGGQVVVPLLGPLYVPARLGRAYASGLHEIGGRWLFVTRGLGEVFPPLRVNCPPEVALLTLRRAPTSH